MGIKDDIKNIINKDYFNIGGAGIQKVRRNNILAFIAGSSIILIALFYIILNRKTNYFKLSDFEDYVEEFQENKDLSKFEKINIGVKIMPSYNLEKNILYLKHTKNVIYIY
jgi:hypothetical protein